MSTVVSRALSTDHRLHYSWEYRRFFKQNQVFRTSECTLFRIQSPRPHFRVGITLKARGSSVERNQVKRQIREFFRTHGHALGSFDYNVVVPASKKMAYPYAQRLRKSLEKEFLRAVAAQ